MQPPPNEPSLGAFGGKNPTSFLPSSATSAGFSIFCSWWPFRVTLSFGAFEITPAVSGMRANNRANPCSDLLSTTCDSSTYPAGRLRLWRRFSSHQASVRRSDRALHSLSRRDCERFASVRNGRDDFVCAKRRGRRARPDVRAAPHWVLRRCRGERSGHRFRNAAFLLERLERYQYRTVLSSLPTTCCGAAAGYQS